MADPTPTTPKIKAYNKQVVVNSNGGADANTFTGTRANAVLNRLNDNPRYWHTTDDAGAEIYFDTEGDCGFCKIATVTYTNKEIDALDCEDGIPNCPDATKQNPVENYTQPVK